MYLLGDWFHRLGNVIRGRGNRPENRLVRIVIWSIVGAMILMVLAGGITFLLSLRGAEKTMVPDVRNLALSEALIDLQDKDLYPRLQLRYFSDPGLKGKVVEQSPAAGTLVRAGRRISLTVSQGAVVDKVGDYVGRTLEDVRSELRTLFTTFDAVLKIGDVSYVFDQADPGTILEQSPQPGTEISGVTDLKLVVSRGPDVKRVKLPSYRGMGWQEAMDTLARRNVPFTFSLVAPEGSQGDGVVVSQSPAPGEEVPEGTRVNLKMTPPSDIPDGSVFGIFERVLPNYPVAVDITLEIVDQEGNRTTVFKMKHPGGDIGVPYVAPANATLILKRFDTEVISEVVRPAVLPEQQDVGQ